jgi:hypothetical protein
MSKQSVFISCGQYMQAETVGVTSKGYFYSMADRGYRRKPKKIYRTCYLLTEEERAKCRPIHLNGGRPPVVATPEQLAKWDEDMQRRKRFHSKITPLG